MLRNKESLVLFGQERSSWIIAGSVNRVHGELLASLAPVAVVSVKVTDGVGAQSHFSLTDKERACNLNSG